jgi:hypothetical protein
MTKKKLQILDQANIERLQSRGVIRKGVLVKYRFNDHTLRGYDLDSDANEWQWGIIKEVYWYTITSRQLMVDDANEEKQYMVSYDLQVYQMDTQEECSISLTEYEIYVLV